jgi:hypothetical protein
VLRAAALALPLVAIATLGRWPEPRVIGTQFLAALQMIVGVALGVSGVRDV